MARAPRVARCGTYAGYQAHLKRGEKACRECLGASAAWRRQYRAGRADVRAFDKWQRNTYHRALSALARAHPAEFYRLLAAEREREPAPALLTMGGTDG